MRLREWLQKVRIIAEIGVNHEGSVEVAQMLVRRAAEAGVDAVKFQVYNPDYEYVSRGDGERYARTQRFALQPEEFHSLVSLAEELGLVAFATPLGLESLDWVASRCPIIKISSGDIVYERLVRRAAASGGILFISTGLAHEKEIETALRWVEFERGADFRDALLLFHCVSAYPAPIEQVNLKSIPYLRDKYGTEVGYSDHTLGSVACLGAVAVGATALEKHFTLEKEGRQFRDHALSLDPGEMAELVRSIHALEQALGRSEKSVRECEEKGRQQMRRSIGVSRQIEAGTVLRDEDLTLLRPASGMSAENWQSLVGKKLVRTKLQAELLAADDVERD